VTAALLERTLATGHDGALRADLTGRSGLPGPRLDVRVVWAFADAVAAVVVGPEPPVVALEALLDRWAALDETHAPGDQPAVILPCAAVAAYGAVGAARSDWWDDEVGKLRRAAGDPRWRVREVVAQSLQRLLAADWTRAVALLTAWAGAADPLVVRAAVAGVAEPPLLLAPAAAADAHGVQAVAVAAFRSWPPATRRSAAGRVLRQALGFTVSVTTAATGDFGLLRSLAASGDRDERWIVDQNLRTARLRPWPDERGELRPGGGPPR
jgi:hypothetical protein